jgi:hypothetical protein
VQIEQIAMYRVRAACLAAAMLSSWTLAIVAAGLFPAHASSPGIPRTDAPPNVTSFAFTPEGAIWAQVQGTSNACPPDCSAGNLWPPGHTYELDGAPAYENVDKAGSIVWAPGTNGYWIVTPFGEIHSRGGAPVLCSNELENCSGFYPSQDDQIVAVAADPKGRGLWAVGREGAVWTASVNPANSLPSYGDAQDSGGWPTGIAAAPDGTGYCISISDGGVYCRGENDPNGGKLYRGRRHNVGTNFTTGIAFYVDANNEVEGYWLVAKDGGVFSFSAPFWGSTGGNDRVVTNIVAFPQPGQDSSNPQTIGYGWINRNGDVTVCVPPTHCLGAATATQVAATPQ